MVDRLSNLVSILNTPGLDFRSNRAQGDDILGDAYEYLMRHFATESGKSKGQFYTPAEVSRIMAQVIGLAGATDSKQSIYDPTCGSGSLLLKAHDEAKSTTGLDLAIYGQEMDNATSALAKMNMILHDCPTAEIWKDNTLSAPHFKDPMGKLKLFDFIIANPPFSTKAWSNGFNPAEDEYNRFSYGIPPEKNGDYAFLLHMLTSLKSTGKAAVILPHGVLFRGGAEGVIRKRILQQGYIKGIIGLPASRPFSATPSSTPSVRRWRACSRPGVSNTARTSPASPLATSPRRCSKSWPKTYWSASKPHRCWMPTTSTSTSRTTGTPPCRMTCIKRELSMRGRSRM